LKYTGSKARISTDISNIINNIIKKNNIETYIEPFVGGANVIENIICKNRYGLDNNKYLIALWKSFLIGWQPDNFIDKETYQNVKENRDSFPEEFVGLVGICASYNGNWFSSYGGYSPTKTGKDRNYYEESIKNIKNQLPKLVDVKFSVRDYKDLKIEKMNNFFIYCDPPYAQNKSVYNDKGFNHIEFWDWIRILSKNNYVIVSEYVAPDDFSIIWEKQLSKMFPKQKKDTPTEKLFVYKTGKLKDYQMK
jgi:DNA adenine methylase